MNIRNSVLVCALLGVGFAVSPVLAQEIPPSPPPEQPQTWTGALLDAGCRISAPNDKCEVTEATKIFGIQTTDDKYYRFDGNSNGKVLIALKSAEKQTGEISVSINGTLSGTTLKVETIQFR